ncbi:MAG TPA: hypothetical protein VMF06_05190, partial [Candidatus Limnocylindria bacterium]|nr:hypothetical protein [Candidatus Limnocylindria bacterium]
MKRFSGLLASAAVFAAGSLARAETVISTFDDFNLDVLYAWSDATIVSGPTSYDVTDTGFGSGYKNLDPNLDATGETTIELTVEISAPGANPNQAVSGPIVSLGDADGTLASYAWYGQTPGVHVLKALLTSGTGLNTGGKPGLDLSNLDFFHLQDDPGAYHGVYTISFQ